MPLLMLKPSGADRLTINAIFLADLVCELVQMGLFGLGEVFGEAVDLLCGPESIL